MKNENTANQARAYLQIPGLVMTIQILDTEVKYLRLKTHILVSIDMYT